MPPDGYRRGNMTDVYKTVAEGSGAPKEHLPHCRRPAVPPRGVLRINDMKTNIILLLIVIGSYLVDSEQVIFDILKIK